MNRTTGFAVALRFASTCLILVVLMSVALSGKNPAVAQSFGEAFSSQVTCGGHCTCQPIDLSVNDRVAMRDFLVNAAEKLRLRWHPETICEPQVIAVFEHGRFRVRQNEKDNSYPRQQNAASRLVMQVLRESQPPLNQSFAVVFTLDTFPDEGIVEKTVEGTVLTGGNTERWTPFDGAPVISSARDIDFGPYMAELQRKIKREWAPRDLLESRRVVCVFKILADGSIANLRLLPGRSSPDGLDHAALTAVRKAAPFKHLPDGAPPDVDIQFTFDYCVFTHHCDAGDPVYSVALSCPEAMVARRANLHGSTECLLRPFFETNRFAFEKRQEFDR